MGTSNKTWMPKEKDIAPKWFLIDAKGKVLGKLAVEVSRILQGKHTPRYTPHMDMGDFCVVINAKEISVSADKAETKIYFNHSGWRGGLKLTPFKDMLAKHPERVIERAVHGMLPKGRRGDKLIKKLKVYEGPEHPHKQQKFEEVTHG